MIAIVGDLIEAIDTFVAGIAGWRYLLSNSYRKETHARWKQQTKSRVLLEILGGALGLFFTLLPVGILLYLVL